MTTVVPPDVDRAAPARDFADCYRLHYPRLQRALRLAGADPATAEDVAQEAFARALVHWWRVSRGANPPGYVYRAGFRLLGRRLARRPDAPAAPDGSEALAGGGSVDVEVTTRVAVEAVLAAMPPRRRLCATLCFVVGLSPAEAAEVLGIAAGTVRKQLDDARAALRGLG